MRRMILATFAFIFCLSWGEVKVEKVLETTSIKEYNQWVKKNKARYPELRPIFIQYLVEYTGGRRKHTIEYYDENGEKLKEEAITESLTYVWVPPTNDRVIITKTPGYKTSGNYKVTVKDKKGSTLFSLERLLSYLAGEIYMESLEDDDPFYALPDDELKIFGKNGQVINTIKGLGGFDKAFYPADERYVVFKALHYYPGATYIMLDNKGKEVWRKHIEEPISTSIFISKNGMKIGMNCGGDVLLYKEDGTLFRKYNAFDNNVYKNKKLISALSDNGDWLVTGAHSKIRFYNNKTGNLVWQDDSALAKNNDEVRYAHIIGDGEKIIALCCSHNLYVFDQTGSLQKIVDLNLGFIKKPKTVWGIDEKGYGTRKVIGYEEVRTGSWKSDLVGRYLIITKECFPSQKERGTELDTIIIYEISDK